MKILQVIDTLNVGGAERVFVDMCNILQENVHHITALLLLEDGGELASGLKVPLLHLRRKSKWSLKSMFNCSKIINEYDVVHCHNKHVFQYVKLVSLLSFSKRAIVLHDHSSFVATGKQLFILKYILKPDFYIGTSGVINKHAIEKLNIKARRVFLLENIIRKSFDFESKTKTDFILVSNIKSLKNNLFAVQLLEEFSQKSLKIVGKIQDKLYFNNLLDFIDSKNLKVEFLTDTNNPQNIIKNAKIGLHTSKSETGPLVLIEYLAQGVPFLAYETGEVAKILKPHFPEYFMDNFDLEQWKTKLDFILKNEPDAAKMNTVFEQYFGEKQYYSKLIAIYKCINN